MGDGGGCVPSPLTSSGVPACVTLQALCRFDACVDSVATWFTMRRAGGRRALSERLDERRI